MWAFICIRLLKISNVTISGEIEGDLSITNKETMMMFQIMVKRWLKKGQRSLNSFAIALENSLSWFGVGIEDKEVLVI